MKRLSAKEMVRGLPCLDHVEQSATSAC
jgi:hypothetical protein